MKYFRTFQNIEPKTRFISQCVIDNTIVDKRPWDTVVMQRILFTTGTYKNALLFPLSAQYNVEKVQLPVFNIVCGVRVGARRVCKRAKRANLSQDFCP